MVGLDMARRMAVVRCKNFRRPAIFGRDGLPRLLQTLSVLFPFCRFFSGI
jgi:hypothetical protein